VTATRLLRTQIGRGAPGSSGVVQALVGFAVRGVAARRCGDAALALLSDLVCLCAPALSAVRAWSLGARCS
jgi:hypothetical protein